MASIQQRICSRSIVGLIIFSLLALTSEAGLFGPKTVPRKFVILGNQTIEHRVADNGPVSAENEVIKIEVTGLMGQFEDGGDSKMNRTFGFTAKKPLTISRVVVEDVSGATPELMVADEAPVLSKQNYWIGNAASKVINETDMPWLYLPGDDWRVFRFTITTAEKGTLVLLQPSLISQPSKRNYTLAARQAGNAPTKAQMNRFLSSVGKVIKEDVPCLFMPVIRKPAPGNAELFENLKNARKEKAIVAIASEQGEWALDLVGGALATAKKDQFKGQVLVVVAPGAEAAQFDKLIGTSGLAIKVGPLVD